MRRILGIVAAIAAASLHAQSITTVAGGGSDDGQAATAIPISSPRGIALDAAGNVYFAEGAGRVRRVDAASGVVKTIAGNGAAGLSGDGALAVGATLNNPEGIVFDSSGNLYIADNANNRIRRVDAKSGVITTYAGGGTPASGIGDGGVATSAILAGPTGLAIDRGFLYVAESAFDGNRVRRIDLATNVINTLDAGELNDPFGIAIDAAGNIFISEIANGLVRRIDAQTKAIDTYAGGGNPADGLGDNLPATQAKLGSPSGIAFDKDGNLLISCIDTGSMRKVDKTTKIITTFASTVYLPTFIAADAHGVFWSSDDEFVYRVASDGSLTPIAGGGTFIGDGRVATAAILQDPDGIAVAANGDLYIADAGHNVLRRVSASNDRVSTVAGQPGRVYAPPEQEGGDAASAVIGFPRDVAIDSTGALYTADLNNDRIWRIDTAHKITTYAGGGTAPPTNGASATSVRVDAWGLAFDASDNLYWVGDNALYRIDAKTKTITIVAGQTDAGFSGDGGPAAQAKLSGPRGVAIDADGNVFVSDNENGRVRKIDRTGTITTYAGGDNQSIGDDGPATAAQVGPQRIAIQKRTGDLYIADGSFHRVRRVSAATKIITTVAGSATFYTDADFAGDGGRATAAKLNFGFGTPAVAVTDGGDVYVADVENNRVRAVFACATVGTPLLVRPADNSSVSTAPTLSWSDTLNAFRYDVLLDTVSPPVKLAASDISKTSFTPANLQPSTKYFWRVVAKGDSFCASQSSASSVIASFTTSGSCAASPFDAIAPADGAQVQASSVLLSWNASTDASGYDVYFSSASALSRIATAIAATSFRVDVGTGRYSWFVVAHAKCDDTQTASTPVRSFTAFVNSLTCPQQFAVTPSSPANGAANVSQSPDLIWSTNGLADSYDLYLGTAADPPLFASNLVAVRQSVTSLDPATKYFWRVVAHTPCTQVAVSSPIVSFTTGTCTAPGAPSILFAPSSVSAGSTYSIVWSPAPGLDAAGAYLLERSTSPGFESILDSQVSSSTAASFIAGNPGTLYHRVRAVSACDPTKVGLPSGVAKVTIVPAPPNIVFTVQPAAKIVDLGQKLEDANGTFTLENIGASSVQVIVGRQELNGSPPFFSIVDPGGQDAAFITLDPRTPHTFATRYSGPPNNVAASYQGVIFAAATGAGLAVTPYAFVNLKVGGTIAPPPQFIVDGVVSEYAAFPALNGDDANRDPIKIGVRNNGASPVDVGFEIGPEVWLTTDASWNSTRIEPQTTRTMNLSTKRSRAPNGSALPRYTYLTVRTRDGAAARLLVQDNGDFALNSGRSARLDVGVRSFIVPEVVSKVTPRGIVVTRLRLSNVGGDPVQTQLIFTPAGADGFDAAPVRSATIVVPPNDVVTLTDPIVQVFKLARPSTGQVEVRLPPERVGLVSVSATTISLSGGAPIVIPIVNRGDGARNGAPQIISGITKTSSLTTSVVFAETSGNDHALVRAILRDASGVKLGEVTSDVLRNGYARFDDIVASAGAAAASQASLEINITSGGGVVSGTAIIVPANSDAGTAIASRAESGAGTTTSALARLLRDDRVDDGPSVTLTTVVPLIATPTSSGAAPSYRTLVGFAAPTNALASFTTTLYQGGTTSLRQSFSVPAGTTRVVNDILGDLFGLPPSTTGSIFVQAPADSRVYALVQPLGSGSTVLPPGAIQLPTTLSEALTSVAGSSQRPLFVDGLEQSIDSTRGTRWLLLLNEVAGANGVVNVRLYEAANRTVPIAEKDVAIAGLQELQLDTVFSALGLDAPDRAKDRTNVQCVVTAKSGNARVSASAIAIDNVTGATQVIALAPSVGSATPSVSLVTPVITTNPTPAPRRRSVRH
jgi:sugar lactone lactonase YvrE